MLFHHTNPHFPTRGAANKAQFKELLKESSPYTGIFKKFFMGAKRYNSSAQLLKYIYGQLLRLNYHNIP